MDHLLGLDLGTVTLGIAISRTGIISSGYEEYRFPAEQWHIALQEVIRIVKLEKIKIIVLGLPLNAEGTESVMSGKARAFMKMIQEALPEVKTDFQDERWSTMTATDYLLEADMSRKKRKKVIDKVAAQYILETYMNEKGE